MAAKPFIEMVSESFARSQKIVRKIRESKTPRRSWQSLMASFRKKLGFTNEGLTFCGWPIDFVVETHMPKKDEKSKVSASSLLTCMVMCEAYRAIVLGEDSKVATSKGVVEASKLVKEASLLEGIQNWNEWLGLLFPHVDPTYVEFLSKQGAKK